MENEIWKPISGYEGIYEISSYGRVKSLARIIDLKYRNMKRVVSEFYMIQQVDRNGYCRIGLRNGEMRRAIQYNVHRLVAIHFLDKIEGKDFVNHKDGNKQNNYKTNLEWCTKSENTIHSYKYLNRSREFGEKNCNAIFKSEQVIQIRKYYTQGVSISDIAKIYKVKYKPIFRIVKNEIWRHLL